MQVRNRQQSVTKILSWKKEVLVRLFLLIIKLIIPTNHDGDWHYDDYYVMQKLFIPQRLMAIGKWVLLLEGVCLSKS